MQRDEVEQDVCQAWQAQPVMTPFTATLVRKTTLRFLWIRRVSKAIDLVFFLALALYFAAVSWFGEVPLCRIGSALVSAAGFYAAHRTLGVHLRHLRSEISAIDCLGFHRIQLTERRDRLKTAPSWAIWPFAPGVTLACLGWVLAAPADWLNAVGILTVWIGVSVAVYASNGRAIAQIQKELDLLDGAIEQL
jgi:hypothetical protein